MATTRTPPPHATPQRSPAAGGEISGFDATAPEDRDAILRLIHHFNVLKRDIHTPYLDGLVLDKYVVGPLAAFAEATGGAEGSELAGRYANAQEAKVGRDAALGNMVALVTLVTDHKQRTLEVLEAVTRRDNAWSGLQSALAACRPLPAPASSGSSEGAAAAGPSMAAIDGGAPPTTTTQQHHHQALPPPSIEASAIVQHHAFLLQRATLDVVEKIVAWRSGLALPHPFMVGNENYLLKIMMQTAQLAADQLMNAVIPMQTLFFTFPLFSNLSSLSRYAEDPSKPNYSSGSRSSAHRAANGYGPVTDVATTKRLQAAEKAVLEEVDVQLHVVHVLLNLCRQGRFLPVLNLRKLYPKAYDGLKHGAATPTTASQTLLGTTALNGTASTVGGGYGTSKFGTTGAAAVRGIPLMNAALQQKLEILLLHALDVLRDPPFRAAYEAAMATTTRGGGGGSVNGA